MNLISGNTEDFKASGAFEQMGNYRRQVFIERLGWQLKSFDGLELDQFDRQDTLYVIARDEGNAITGCARLLPTTTPYLLGEVFPQLFNGLPPPCSPDVWELSRFAAVDLNASHSTGLEQFSASVAANLLRESIDCAKRHGAKRIVSVSPVGVERLIRKIGFHAHRAGPPMVVGGHPIFACWIDC